MKRYRVLMFKLNGGWVELGRTMLLRTAVRRVKREIRRHRYGTWRVVRLDGSVVVDIEVGPSSKTKTKAA